MWQATFLICAAAFFFMACACIRAIVLRLGWMFWLMLGLACVGICVSIYGHVLAIGGHA